MKMDCFCLIYWVLNFFFPDFFFNLMFLWFFFFFSVHLQVEISSLESVFLFFLLSSFFNVFDFENFFSGKNLNDLWFMISRCLLKFLCGVSTLL